MREHLLYKCTELKTLRKEYKYMNWKRNDNLKKKIQFLTEIQERTEKQNHKKFKLKYILQHIKQ